MIAFVAVKELNGNLSVTSNLSLLTMKAKVSPTPLIVMYIHIYIYIYLKLCRSRRYNREAKSSVKHWHHNRYVCI